MNHAEPREHAERAEPIEPAGVLGARSPTIYHAPMLAMHAHVRRLRVALVSAALVASCALAGCTTLDKIDKGSDELLDKLDGPSGPSSSPGPGQTPGQTPGQASGSGLSVAHRSDMGYRSVLDINGNTVIVWGQNKSTSKTPGHDTTMLAKALALARSGDYEYVTLQRSWRTATNRVGSSGKIPDIIGVRHNGKVDAFEVRSDTDTRKDLMQRLEKGMQTLPPENRGEINIIKSQP